MGNGTYDEVGCAYGRKLRKDFENHRRYCTEQETRTAERFSFGDRQFQELKEEIDRLRREMGMLARKFYWLLGVLTVAGNLASQILVMLIQHYLR